MVDLWSGALRISVLGIFLWFYWRQRAMKKRQEALVASLQGMRYWRINLDRQPSRDRWLRLLPFEAKGVLIEMPDHFVIKGHWNNAPKPFESKLARDTLTVEWLGNTGLRQGNMHWAKLGTPKGSFYFTADTGMNALASREALSDIFRAAFPHYPLDARQTQDFALEKNPRTLALILIAGILGVGALLDTWVFSKYELIESQLIGWAGNPVVWLATLLATALLGFVSYRWQISGAVPARESMALSMLTVGICLSSAVPILKRVDQLLAGGQSHVYPYRLVNRTALIAVNADAGLPKLWFPRTREYWTQFPEGSVHDIPLLRGPTGLWQLDHARFDPPIIAFYKQAP